MAISKLKTGDTNFTLPHYTGLFRIGNTAFDFKDRRQQTVSSKATCVADFGVDGVRFDRHSRESKLIVTYNLSDFSSNLLISYNIEAVSPDDFVFGLLRTNPDEILNAVKFHRESLTRPCKTVDEYLVTLEKHKLHKTVMFLREHRTDI